jgi:hypothetical protein
VRSDFLRLPRTLTIITPPRKIRSFGIMNITSDAISKTSGHLQVYGGDG